MRGICPSFSRSFQQTKGLDAATTRRQHHGTQKENLKKIIPTSRHPRERVVALTCQKRVLLHSNFYFDTNSSSI
ncbi:Uncharacterized protein TCM_013372 [Theobroma cacao]|uniref:Uncharacterized protein n=1 Tax=Theobroma cacao TaxID=3641 RepID=A0A061FVJ5_THECC|nr:Uncharacterized protein TCM_013372 [Theobroma cacao]